MNWSDTLILAGALTLPIIAIEFFVLLFKRKKINSVTTLMGIAFGFMLIILNIYIGLYCFVEFKDHLLMTILSLSSCFKLIYYYCILE